MESLLHEIIYRAIQLSVFRVYKKVIELWSALAPSLLTVILTYNCFTVGKTRGNCSKFVWLNPSLNNVNHLSLLLYNDLLK